MLELTINIIVIISAIILFLGIVIGIYIGQAIIVHMNKDGFERLKFENERMHYEIAEYKAKEAYEQKQILQQAQEQNRPKGGEVI